MKSALLVLRLQGVVYFNLLLSAKTLKFSRTCVYE